MHAFGGNVRIRLLKFGTTIVVADATSPTIAVALAISFCQGLGTSSRLLKPYQRLL
jgi:hypothetical protein